MCKADQDDVEVEKRSRYSNSYRVNLNNNIIHEIQVSSSQYKRRARARVGISVR